MSNGINKITNLHLFSIIMLTLILSDVVAEERILTVDSKPLYAKIISAPGKLTRGESRQIQLRFGSYIRGLECSSSYSLFAAGFINGEVSIHRMDSGEEMFRIQAHASNPEIAWFSDNDKVLVTTSDGDTARFWDTATGKELFNTEFMPRAYPIVYQSRYLILIGSDISILDMKTGRLQLDHLGYGGSYKKGVSISGDNKLYLLSGSELHIFDIVKNNEGLTLNRNNRVKLHSYGKRFNWIKLDSSNKSLILASKNGGVLNIDINTFDIKVVTGDIKEIDSFDFNDNDDFIFSGKPIQKEGVNYSGKMRDVVYVGDAKKGINNYFNLYTWNRAYTCFRGDKNNGALVGTMTNIVSTNITNKVQP